MILKVSPTCSLFEILISYQRNYCQNQGLQRITYSSLEFLCVDIFDLLSFNCFVWIKVRF